MLKKILVTFLGIAFLLIGFSSSASAQAEQKYITIKGSDTMIHLVSTWAEEFMKKNKDIDVSVTGGGSGTGIAALINATTDICAASRKIKGKEKQRLAQKGKKAAEIVVAKDGIAVIVNPQNPVSELTLKQIKNIYTGKYKSWKEVGGADKKIQILSRESSSGTYVFFQKHVLEKEDYSSRARLMPATSAIVQSVSSDKWAIGYVGLGYAAEAKGKIKILAVKQSKKAKAVMPSEKTVVSGAYSLARPLHFYTIGKAKGLVKTFIDFALSNKGQEIVKKTGYVAVASGK